jgi:hypothetical protein
MGENTFPLGGELLAEGGQICLKGGKTFFYKTGETCCKP